MTAQRQVDGNPVNPGVKRAFSMKLIEFLEPAHKSVLQDVLCVLRRTHQPDDGREETVLVSPDQNPECLGLARAARCHETVVVLTPGHHGIRRFHSAQSSRETVTGGGQLASPAGKDSTPARRGATHGSIRTGGDLLEFYRGHPPMASTCPPPPASSLSQWANVAGEAACHKPEAQANGID